MATTEARSLRSILMAAMAWAGAWAAFSLSLLPAPILSAQTLSAQTLSAQTLSAQTPGLPHGGGAGANPLAGTWLQQIPAQAGGTINNYMEYKADGSFRSSAVNIGGPQNGLRNQMWGQYTIKPAAGGRYLVTMTYRGKAPLQLCMPGMGCRPTPALPTRPDQGYFQFRGYQLQSTNGFSAQRSAIPPVLMQQLPASWTLQGPPPLPSASPSTATGGRYVSPKIKTPGLAGNCDDLQQSRICTYGNGGFYHKDPQTGCMVCTQR